MDHLNNINSLNHIYNGLNSYKKISFLPKDTEINIMEH